METPTRNPPPIAQTEPITPQSPLPSTPTAAITLPSPSAPIPDRSIDDISTSPIVPPVLTHREVRSDPILAALALKQGKSTKTPIKGFKAKPAPTNMGDISVGPRMTKAAALRQGLKWEETKRVRPATADASSKPFAFGSKRADAGAIRSLAAPSVAPRPTKASQLRTGEVATTSAFVRRDPAEVLAENKAKAAEEKVKRRASIAIPASLSAPMIAPRANRSSQLRAGGKMEPPSSFRSQSALTTTTAANVDRKAEEDKAKEAKEAKDAAVKRRASVIGTIRSLGAPSILPRTNKSAMLRAPPVAADGASTSVGLPSSSSTTTLSRPKIATAGSTQSISTLGARSGASQRPASASGAPSAFGQGPRPTRASMLRAGLGAKVTR